MKAISIKQPWASLIAAGIKTREIRQWPTDHRGPLLIVSSRRPVLEGHRHGAALCTVEIVGCRPMTPDDVPFACVRDFYHGHYAWELGRVQLIEPFGVVGQLRLFDVADGLVKPIAQPPVGPPAFMSGTMTGRLFGPDSAAKGKP